MTIETEYRIVEKSDGQGRLLSRSWKGMHADGANRLNGPAVEEFDPDTGKLIAKKWISQSRGGLHREGNNPAIVVTDPVTDVVVSEEYCFCGYHHRDDGGPTKILRNKSNGVIVEKEFHIDAKLHRDYDLPAVMEFDSSSGLIRRLEYYRMGQLHRSHGPAVVEYDEDANVIFSEFYEYGQKTSSGLTELKP